MWIFDKKGKNAVDLRYTKSIKLIGKSVIFTSINDKVETHSHGTEDQARKQYEAVYAKWEELNK